MIRIRGLLGVHEVRKMPDEKWLLLPFFLKSRNLLAGPRANWHKTGPAQARCSDPGIMILKRGHNVLTRAGWSSQTLREIVAVRPDRLATRQKVVVEHNVSVAGLISGH